MWTRCKGMFWYFSQFKTTNIILFNNRKHHHHQLNVFSFMFSHYCMHSNSTQHNNTQRSLALYCTSTTQHGRWRQPHTIIIIIIIISIHNMLDPNKNNKHLTCRFRQKRVRRGKIWVVSSTNISSFVSTSSSSAIRKK